MASAQQIFLSYSRKDDNPYYPDVENYDYSDPTISFVGKLQRFNKRGFSSMVRYKQHAKSWGTLSR